MSIAFMVLGIFGALSLAAATLAVFPNIGPQTLTEGETKRPHPSLLLPSAMASLKDMAPDPLVIRATLQSRISPSRTVPGFVTQEDHVAMVLAQIMARWECMDVSHLTDDQVRELWLVERLMRCGPAEAGALSCFFVSPDAMLAMRDALAEPVSV